MAQGFAQRRVDGQPSSQTRAWLRAAIWAGAVALLVALPKPADAAELSAADNAINADIKLGDAAGSAPTAWLGAKPHFVMVGAYKDFTFDIAVPDLATATDFAVEAKREYRPLEGGKLAYIDFEIAVALTTNGIEREFEFEFENADFSTHALPTTFTLKDAEFPEGAFSNLELQIEWEWVEKSVIVNEEQLITDGALTVALEEGTPAADGTVPNGLIGGFLTGSFEGKPIAISFTAPVTESEIDD